jgi:hypothetical protein
LRTGNSASRATAQGNITPPLSALVFLRRHHPFVFGDDRGDLENLQHKHRAFIKNGECQSSFGRKEAVLTETSANLEQTRQTLASSRDQLSKVEFDLSTKLTELNQKTEEYKEVLNEKEEILARLNAESGERSEIMRRYEQCSVKISDIDANVYAMIVRLGVGISNNDLKKIPLADANLGGDDADGDGLSDMIEHALGTDPNKKDTDNDGYNDKEEILNGFNPLGPGMMPIDKAFADRQKGKMLLQVENKGEAWYVNPDDGKRYFLGKPADAIRVFAGFGQ